MNYSYDGQLLLSSSDDKTLHLYKIENQKFLCEMTGHLNWVRSATFSPDNRLIASGGEDKMSILWDTETKNILSQFFDHSGTINSCKFNSDGTCLELVQMIGQLDFMICDAVNLFNNMMLMLNLSLQLISILESKC